MSYFKKHRDRVIRDLDEASVTVSGDFSDRPIALCIPNVPRLG